jgi:uncharacterized protein YndB with AHSA1/START domain
MSQAEQRVDAIARSVEIRTTPEQLFPHLIDPKSLVRWWPDVAELEPRLGGRVRMEFLGGESVVTGEVTRFEPPHALGFTWVRDETPDVTTRIELTVTPLDETRCRVDVVHSGWEHAPELRPMHDLGWAHFLGCLADLVEGRPVDKTFRPSG